MEAKFGRAQQHKNRSSGRTIGPITSDARADGLMIHPNGGESELARYVNGGKSEQAGCEIGVQDR